MARSNSPHLLVPRFFQWFPEDNSLDAEQTDVHKKHFNCLVQNMQQKDDDKAFSSGYLSCANVTGNVAAPAGRTCHH